jgi:hypothetical protein
MIVQALLYLGLSIYFFIRKRSLVEDEEVHPTQENEYFNEDNKSNETCCARIC